MWAGWSVPSEIGSEIRLMNMNNQEGWLVGWLVDDDGKLKKTKNNDDDDDTMAPH